MSSGLHVQNVGVKKYFFGSVGLFVTSVEWIEKIVLILKERLDCNGKYLWSDL